MFAYYKKYCIEIKNRIVLLFITWISVCLVSYHFKEHLLFVFIDSSQHYQDQSINPYFIFTNANELFYVYLHLVTFSAAQLTGIMSLYHILAFFALGLYYFEYLKLKSIIQLCCFTWLISVILLKFFIIPLSWSFFLSFQTIDNHLQPITFFFEARIFEYFSYFTDFYYTCTFNFQILAISIFFISNLSNKIETVKTFRKLFYFIFIIFATLITPPDIFSQIVLSSILISIYETLLFTRFIN